MPIIENEYLKVEASLLGGELLHVIDKENNQELLYQANEVWPHHDVILFPFIGPDSSYQIDGRKYSCPTQHGFIRTSRFELVEEKEDKLIMEFHDNEKTFESYPLSFSEFTSAFNGTTDEAWQQYVTYGGMPRIIFCADEAEKSHYLKQLFEKTYLSDIIERNKVQRTDILDSLVNILSSSIGSLTNPNKLLNTYVSSGVKDISINTINKYLGYLLDSFLIEKSERYDIKGKKYIHTPFKFYFSDIGLRNSRLNFRQQEENHIMENILFNELLFRGYNVDVGVLPIREGNDKKQVEIDFVCNQFNKRYYIQSSLSLDTREKTTQEERPLLNVPDNFKKIIVVKDSIKPWITEEGISVIGIKEFLLNKNSLDI